MISRLFAALRSALYATVFIGGWGWIALRARSLDTALGIELPAWTRVAGVVLMIPGAALALASVAAFVVRGRGTPAPFDPPREFVVSGPYRWVRNPMFIGALTLFIGFGLWHRSFAIILVTLAAFALVSAFVMFYEEPHLERVFGEAYVRYRREVRRWLPRRPR